MASSKLEIKLALSAVDEASKTLGAVRKQIESLSGTALENTKRMGAAGASAKQLGESLKDAGAGAEKARSSLSLLTSAATKLAAAFAAIKSAGFFVEAADEARMLEARVRAASVSVDDAAKNMTAIKRVAEETISPLSDTATLYLRVSQATRTMGLESERVADVVSIVSKSLQISGASASETSAVMLQFGQALASGVLRGDEFNSMMENSPRLAKALSDALGVSTGQLRRMAEQGQLTADTVVNALLKQKDVIDTEYRTIPQTVGQAWQVLTDKIGQFAGAVDNSIGVTSTIVNVMNMASDAIRQATTAISDHIRGAAAAADGATGSFKTLAESLADPTIAQRVAELEARLRAIQLGTQEAAQRSAEAISEAIKAAEQQISELDRKVSDAVSRASSSISSLAQAREVAEQNIKAQAAEVARAITEREAAIKAAIEQRTISERDAIAETTQLAIESATKRADLARHLTDVTINALAQEEQYRLAVAASEGKTLEERRQNALRVAQDILSARIAAWQQAADAYRSHIDSLIQEEQRHLQAVQQIEDQKRLINLNTEDKIAEIRRRGMTEEEAAADRVAQAWKLSYEAQAALRNGDFERAKDYAQRAMSLYERVAMTRGQEETAITGISQAQQLLNRILDEQADAHRKAASAARDAANEMRNSYAGIQEKIDGLRAALSDISSVSIEIDAAQAESAIADLQKAVSERDYMISVHADLEKARDAIVRFAEEVKNDPHTVPIDADIEAGKSAIDRLREYAEEKASAELKLKTDAAMSSLDTLSSRMQNLAQVSMDLDDAQARQRANEFVTWLASQDTTSEHTITTNVDHAASEIDSLNGRDTSSTHTIYVRRVEANSAGGLVGAVLRYARGGVVPRIAKRFMTGGRVLFPRFSGGVIPGTGNEDTEPYTLDTGAFVLRKAAVQKYGKDAIAKLLGARKYATGGLVFGDGHKWIKYYLYSLSHYQKYYDGSEIDILDGISRKFGSGKKAAMAVAEALAGVNLEKLRAEATLSKFSGLPMSYETPGVQEYGQAANLARVSGAWAVELEAKLAELKALLSDDELKEIDKIISEMNRKTALAAEYYRAVIERNKRVENTGSTRDILARRSFDMKFARGGSVRAGPSDTVPALLTPGEFVVRREVVQKVGLPILEALNSMKLPIHMVRGYATGGLVTDGSYPGGRVVAPGIERTVRLELNIGGTTVSAYTDQSSERALMDALRRAKSRAVAL